MTAALSIRPACPPLNAPQSLTDRPLTDQLALPILLLGAVSISFSGIFVKLSEVGPISTAFFRMALPLPLMAVGLLVSARSRANRRLPRIGWRGWAGIHVAAVFLAFDLIVWHWSLKLIGVGIATLLGNTAPIWVALAGFVFFKERFSPRFLLGLGVALAGVALLVLGGNRSLAVNDWLGLMLATSGAIGYAGYLRGVKAARNSVGLAQVMFWTCAFTALWLLPAALLTEDNVVPHTLHGWLAVSGLAIVSQTIGQGLISWALGHLPAAFRQPAAEPGGIGHLRLDHPGRSADRDADRRWFGCVVRYLRGPSAPSDRRQGRCPRRTAGRPGAQTCRSFDLTGRPSPIECRAKGEMP
jgi:drug/metabolite transporter (DMT)-like permease